MVAHDFRKPLMAIRGFAELVLEEPDLALETRQEFMRTVISETEHLAVLANDTLLITQIETGQFSFHFREVELGPFILESVPLGLSDHSILMDVPAELPEDLRRPGPAAAGADEPGDQRGQVLAPTAGRSPSAAASGGRSTW